MGNGRGWEYKEASCYKPASSSLLSSLPLTSSSSPSESSASWSSWSYLINRRQLSILYKINKLRNVCHT